MMAVVALLMNLWLFLFTAPTWSTSALNLTSSTSSNKVPLYIGGLLPFGGSWDGSGLIPSVDLAIEQINANDDILPDYDLYVIYNDTRCDPGLSSRVLFDQIYQEPQKIMILGAGCSLGSQAIAATAYYWNLITISPASSSPSLSNRQKYPLFYRTYYPDTNFNPARIRICQEYGWTRVATIREDNELFALVADDLVNKMKEANITVISSETFSEDPANQIESLKKQDAKIIFAFAYSDKTRRVFCEALKRNMTGIDYMWMLLGWYSNQWWEIEDGSVDCTVGQLATAVKNSLYISIRGQRLSNAENVIGGIPPSEFDNAIRHRMATYPQYKTYKWIDDHPFAFDATWAIALALNDSVEALKMHNFSDGRVRRLEDFTYGDSETMLVLFNSMARLTFEGITGPVSFEGSDRVGVAQIKQLREDLYEHVIGEYNEANPIDPLKWTRDILWPGGTIPLDHTPKIEVTIIRSHISVGTPMFIATCVLAALGLVMAVAFLVFNIAFRKQRYIKLSSPYLNNLIIAGSMLIYTAVFFSGIDTEIIPANTKTIFCQANVWVLSFGFVMAFGAMFSKTWRVYQVAAFKTPKRKVITDVHLFVMVSVLLFIDVVLLTVWQVVDPMQLTVKDLYVQDDPTTPNQLIAPYVETCTSKHILYWLLSLYVYKGLLLIFGAFLAWETRKVTFAALNDSKLIGISVYNVIILCTIGVTVSYLIGDNPTALYLFISGIIIFCNTVTLLVIFVPKVISVWKNPSGETASSNTTSKRLGTLTSSDTVLKCYNLSEENERLKASVAELTKLLEHNTTNREFCEIGCCAVGISCYSRSERGNKQIRNMKRVTRLPDMNERGENNI